jgi:hypothetical protein
LQLEMFNEIILDGVGCRLRHRRDSSAGDGRSFA